MKWSVVRIFARLFVIDFFIAEDEGLSQSKPDAIVLRSSRTALHPGPVFVNRHLMKPHKAGCLTKLLTRINERAEGLIAAQGRGICSILLVWGSCSHFLLKKGQE